MAEKKQIDLAAASATLAGLRVRALDVDFLGVDEVGHVAVFLGDDGIPPELLREAARTSAVLEALVQTRALPQPDDGAIYRRAEDRAREPIFDAPWSTPHVAVHENPFESYPHLVVAAEGGAEIVRRVMTELGGREVLARDAFAAAFDVLGFISYQELHDGGACEGCRVLADPKDPSPRAPSALAAAGLYVYRFAGASAGWPRGSWIREVTPSVPADLDDIAMRTRESVDATSCALRFDGTRFVDAALLVEMI